MLKLKQVFLTATSILMVFAGLAGPFLVQAQTALPNNIYLPLIVNPAESATPAAFLETFDGMPSAPQPWNPAHWDVTIHTRDEISPTTLTAMQADHGTQCEPPPATHSTSTYDGAVFLCHDHVMTAINEGGYEAIYLTPDHMADFSAAEAVIKFDVSTRRTSNRDWFDVWVTPFDENLQLPLQNFYPDLNGPPHRSVHIFMDSFNGDTPFRAEVYNNFTATAVDGNWWTGFEQFLTPSPSRRDTFELHLSRTHIKFGMPAYNFWWIDKDIPALDWSQGVVQFGHHSYNPAKACNFDGTCGPNTWHWDNVSISPAVPFNLIRADHRYVTAAVTTAINLASPAPANAHLRFTGIGGSLQVSFDGGQSWTAAQVQNQSEQIDGHFTSYWTPIPAGTAQLRFRGQDWFGGGWEVRDISVWSMKP